MITIKLTFSEDELNDLLSCANFTEKAPLKVADLTKARIKELKTELQNTSGTFVEELIDSSRESCANGWLEEFGP